MVLAFCQVFHLLAWLFETLIFFLIGTSAAAYIGDTKYTRALSIL